MFGFLDRDFWHRARIARALRRWYGDDGIQCRRRNRVDLRTHVTIEPNTEDPFLDAFSPISSGECGLRSFRASFNSLTISAWVDKDGGDSRTIKWVEIPNSAIAEALVQHRVDVAQ